MTFRPSSAAAVILAASSAAACASSTTASSAAPTSAALHAPAPVLEPETQRFLDALAAKGGPPIYKLSVADARGVLEGAQASAPAEPRAEIEDVVVAAGSAGDVALRIVRPAGKANATLPAVMYFHGGGWVLGSEKTHDRLVREIANGAGAAVVFVRYTPSPEARFPIAIEQAYAATRYVAEHGAALHVDGARLAVAGDSVGGNMAAAVTLMAKRRGGPALAHQLLFYPVTDAAMSDASYQQFHDGPWLTKPAMAWFFDAYLPSGADRTDPLISPLRASDEELRGLPPATVITAENDVLRDEGEEYARRLTRAGVPVKSARFNGTIHDFVMLNALASTPAARAAVALGNTELQSALRSR